MPVQLANVAFFYRWGRRQYIHTPRWEDICKTWLDHGIPTGVARKLESTVDSGGEVRRLDEGSIVTKGHQLDETLYGIPPTCLAARFRSMYQ